MSPKTLLGKWATGEPMIEWCQRNGLDARRIIDRNDAITISRPSTLAVCTDADGQAPEALPIAQTWIVIDDYAGLKPGQTHRITDGVIEVLDVRVVDSEPPLNPEWVRLLSEGK